MCSALLGIPARRLAACVRRRRAAAACLLRLLRRLVRFPPFQNGLLGQANKLLVAGLQTGRRAEPERKQMS